jgi:dTDP-4-amino-4,6-dideoxygalactose transaminase
MRSIRVHGQGTDRYDNVRLGLNGRFDTIQAAILIEKLTVFAEEIEARQRVAERYSLALAEVARTPSVIPGAASVWAQYTLLVKDRDGLATRLKSIGVPTAVYYPIPLNRQSGYCHYPTAPGGAPVSEALAASVISLPMHPYLDETTQDRIIAAVLSNCSPN